MDKLDLFVCGGDGRVYTSWWSVGQDWSGIHDCWGNIGGVFPAGAPITAISRMPDQTDLFICGGDGHVYTSWWHEGGHRWSGVFDNWRDIGGVFPAGAPVTATTRAPGNLDLFITGNDGRVYTSSWYDGADWSGVGNRWASLGGVFPPGAPVTAICRTPTTIDLFITGNDGRVYTSWWSAGQPWSGTADNWRSIGGFFPRGAPIAATSRNGDNIDLFITGNDGRVYTCWWYAGHEWSGINDAWAPIGGFFPAGAPVTALARTPSTLDLFVTGNDGRVYTAWWSDGAEWSGLHDNWRGLGGGFPAASAVTVTSRNPGNMDVFVLDREGRVWTAWWYQGNEWSSLTDGHWEQLGGVFPAGARLGAVGRVLDAPAIAGEPIRLRADLDNDSAVPVGGWAELTITPNGTATFTGHLHDSGFTGYSVSMVWGVSTERGTVFSFSESGKVGGTISSDDRDHDWTAYGSNPAARDLWHSLEAGARKGASHWEFHAGIDFWGVIGLVFEAVGVVVGVTADALLLLSFIGSGSNRRPTGDDGIDEGD